MYVHKHKLRKKTQSAFYTVVLLRGEVARQHKHLRDHVTERVQEIVEPRTALAPQRDGKRGEKKIPKTIWTLSLQTTSRTEKKQLTQVPCVVKGKEKFTGDIRDF